MKQTKVLVMIPMTPIQKDRLEQLLPKASYLYTTNQRTGTAGGDHSGKSTGGYDPVIRKPSLDSLNFCRL